MSRSQTMIQCDHSFQADFSASYMMHTAAKLPCHLRQIVFLFMMRDIDFVCRSGHLPQTTNAPSLVCRMWHTNERTSSTQHVHPVAELEMYIKGRTYIHKRPNCLHAARPAYYKTNSTCWASLQQSWLTCHLSSQTPGKLYSTAYSRQTA